MTFGLPVLRTFSFCQWLAGWNKTLIIKYRHREEYRHLTTPSSFPDDFTEIGPPE